MHSRLYHQERSPHEDIKRQVIRRWAALHEQVRGNGPDEPAEIKGAREPRVLRAMEVQVIFEAEDGGIGECCFIDILGTESVSQNVLVT